MAKQAVAHRAHVGWPRTGDGRRRGRHSVFAKALLEVLEANADILDGQRLHRDVAARVAYAAANLRFDQVPEYAPIRYAGHEAGEFFLVPGT